MLKYIEVTSSAIQKIGYDPTTAEMIVVFPNGSERKLEGITKEQHASFIGAGSIGKHYSTFFRDNKTKPVVERKTNFK